MTKPEATNHEMSSVIPATPGFFVRALLDADPDRKVELGPQQPVLAWLVNASFENKEDEPFTFTWPICFDQLSSGGWVLQNPDGSITNLAGSIYETEGEFLKAHEEEVKFWREKAARRKASGYGQ